MHKQLIELSLTIYNPSRSELVRLWIYIYGMHRSDVIVCNHALVYQPAQVCCWYLTDWTKLTQIKANSLALCAPFFETTWYFYFAIFCVLYIITNLIICQKKPKSWNLQTCQNDINEINEINDRNGKDFTQWSGNSD